MKNNRSFERNLAAALAAPELKTVQIRQAVFSYCVEAGFITEEDQQANSDRYQWLVEVVDRNILSLSLLEQIILDVSEPSLPSDVQTEVDAKAATIIKNVAKRIMESSLEYSFSPQDPDPKGRLKLGMK